MRLLLPLITLILLALSATAHAFQVGIHDQGADPTVLTGTADLLGIRTARILVRPGNPRVDLVRAYRRAGLQVQAAITVKRWTTPGDIRQLLRAWDGQVHTVSIGNEPELNGVGECTYARLYRRAYQLIRREFPSVKQIGIREASPFTVIEYTRNMQGCRGTHRFRADFFAIHPYCPTGDPWAPCRTRFGRDYLGMGSTGKIARFLRARTTRMWLSRPNGSALPIRATEVSFFSDGPAGLEPQECADRWIRALTSLKRWVEQVVIYGLGVVGPDSRWRSACFLDEHGRRLPAFLSVASWLGRPLPAETQETAGTVLNTGVAGRGAAWEAPPAPASSLVDERPIAPVTLPAEDAPDA